LSINKERANSKLSTDQESKSKLIVQIQMGEQLDDKQSQEEDMQLRQSSTVPSCFSLPKISILL